MSHTDSMVLIILVYVIGMVQFICLAACARYLRDILAKLEARP